MMVHRPRNSPTGNPHSAQVRGSSMGTERMQNTAGPALRAVPQSGADPDGGQPSNMDEFLASAERRAYRIACYALKDQEAALDVVQDAMLKLVEKYSNKPVTEWPALFFTILNNRITDLRRWRQLRESGGKLISLFRERGDGRGEDDLLDAGLGADAQPANQQPYAAALGIQFRFHIDAALARLSDRQRNVFLLREWQGFSVRDTAKILGCSEGSVKQHHFRALRALREQLAEVWEA